MQNDLNLSLWNFTKIFHLSDRKLSQLKKSTFQIQITSFHLLKAHDVIK